MTHEHPGTIVFVDEAAGTEHSRAASEVPETIAWVVVDGDSWPVTRVVARMAGKQRVLRSYGVDGRLLSSTVQVPRRR